MSSLRMFVSRSLGWLIAGTWFLCRVVLLAWATLAIYYSNLPWAALRLGLAAAFAAFAVVPFGAHPTSCYPDYAYDREHLAEYVQAAQSGGDDLAKYLQQYVFDVDERGYRELIGQRRLDTLAGFSASTAAWKEAFG